MEAASHQHDGRFHRYQFYFLPHLNDQKLTATQIRLLAEESERALDEQRRQISIKNDESFNLYVTQFKYLKIILYN